VSFHFLNSEKVPEANPSCKNCAARQRALFESSGNRVWIEKPANMKKKHWNPQISDLYHHIA